MNLTGKVWLGIIGSGLAYEAYTLLNKEKEDTLSEEFWRVAYRRPLIPFGLGMLVGHFVWQSDKLYESTIKVDDGKVEKVTTVKISGPDRRNSRNGVLRQESDKGTE